MIQTALINELTPMKLTAELNKFLQYLAEEGIDDSTIKLSYQATRVSSDEKSVGFIWYSVLVSWVETHDIDNFTQ